MIISNGDGELRDRQLFSWLKPRMLYEVWNIIYSETLCVQEPTNTAHQYAVAVTCLTYSSLEPRENYAILQNKYRNVN